MGAATTRVLVCMIERGRAEGLTLKLVGRTTIATHSVTKKNSSQPAASHMGVSLSDVNFLRSQACSQARNEQDICSPVYIFIEAMHK